MLKLTKSSRFSSKQHYFFRYILRKNLQIDFQFFIQTPFIQTPRTGGEYTNDSNGMCRNGQGNHAYANGKVYSGNWKDDNIHGQGCLTFPNGSKYEVQYHYFIFVDWSKGESYLSHAPLRKFKNIPLINQNW